MDENFEGYVIQPDFQDQKVASFQAPKGKPRSYLSYEVIWHRIAVT